MYVCINWILSDKVSHWVNMIEKLGFWPITLNLCHKMKWKMHMFLKYLG